MVVIQLLLFLFTCVPVRSENVLKGRINGIVLDVDGTNSANVAVEEGTLYGVTFKSFFMRDNHFFTSVVEGGATLWKAGAEGKCTAVNIFKREGHTPLLTLYNKGLGLSCFEKEAGEWKAIGAEEFDLKHAGMRAGSRALPKSPVLDIGNIDDKIASNYENLLGGALQKSFLPLESFFSKVVDGKETVWDGSGDKECSMALYKSRNGVASFTLQVVGKGSKAEFRYFKNEGSGWVVINAKEAKVLDEEIMGVAKQKAKEPVTLDLSSVNTQDIFVDQEALNDVEDTLYLPRNGKAITKIVDAEVAIWNSESGQICTAAFYSYKDDVVVLELHVRSDTGYSFRHFGKLGGEWQSIEREEYNRLYDEILGNEDEIDDLSDEAIEEVLKEYEIIKSAPGKVLNVIDPNETEFEVLEHKYKNASYHSYTPKDDSYISSVLYGSETMWTAKEGDKCTSIVAYVTSDHVLVKLEMTNDSKSTYYENVSGEWKVIDGSNFSKKATAMMSTDGLSYLLNLDLATPDLENIVVYEASDRGFDYTKFYPVSSSFISSISDSDIPVWKASSGSECTVVESFSNWVSNILYISVFKSGYVQHQYFEKVDGEWIIIMEDRFKSLLSMMKNLPENFATLDLSVGDSNVIVEEDDHRGVHNTNYYPVQESHVFSVVEDDVNVWTANNYNDKCTLVEVYRKDYSNVLILHLMLGGSRTFKYFIKGVGWNEISKDAFFYKLNTMMSEESLPPTSPDSVLDIFNGSNEEGAIYYESTDKGVTYKAYFPKYGIKIAEVVDLFVELWKAGPGDECALVESYSKNGVCLLSIYFRNGGNTLSKHYEYSGGEWIELSEDAYNELHKRTIVPDKPKQSVSLDIEYPDPSTINAFVNDYKDYQHTCGTYSPKEGVLVSSVVDNGAPIWTAEEGERCAFVAVYYGSGITIAHVSVNKGSEFIPVHFQKMNNGKWTEVNESYFSEMLRVILKAGRFTLDISDPDKKKVEVYDHDIKGVKHRTFFPNRALELTKVTEAGVHVWTGADGDKCTAATLSTKDTRAVMLLHVKNGDSFEFKYVGKGDGKWNELDRDAFYDALKDMMENSGKLPTSHTALNLAKPNENKFVLESKGKSGISYVSIKPKNGVAVSSVSYAKTMLWKGQPGDKCTGARVYTTPYYPLISIRVRTSGVSKSLRFVRSSGKWNNVTKKTFRKRLSELVDFDEQETLDASTTDSFDAASLEVEFPPEPIVLDLTNPDKSKLKFFEDRKDGIEEIDYYPNEGFYVTTILEDNATIWKREGNQTSTLVETFARGDVTLMVVHVLQDERFGVKYFSKSARGWEEIAGDVFSKEYNNMKSLSRKSFTPFGSILDLDNPDSVIATVDEVFVNGIQHARYNIKDGVDLVSVADAGATIWEAKNGEECVSVEVFSDAYFDLVSLRIKSGDKYSSLYFERDGKVWRSMSQDKFDEIIAVMHGMPELTVLNLSRVDEMSFEIDREEENGVKQVLYTPKDDVDVVSIVDENAAIWRAKEHFSLKSATLVSNGQDTILHVCSNVEDLSNFEYFEKNGDEWRWIESDEFEKIMERMTTSNAQKSADAETHQNLGKKDKPVDESIHAILDEVSTFFKKYIQKINDDVSKMKK
ncbi:hypothetical protein BEWA_046790 [Theileria equi strain WA]|uniref:Signal peptide-containing protein n=1 Tax=Theileria equi strain WA TaxID=1537102 RepID=L1LAC8_THEEQ|nr:hypothetical protein BEWA_046790 [Theileria equi strain WA]EKX72215.1 hypothetical protein BEWA_046790 [Theileria equi strain WA]|eukprot:XP_004831667.1 hypothetical protein BEWA_046790 [Theileria equi strain WA]